MIFFYYLCIRFCEPYSVCTLSGSDADAVLPVCGWISVFSLSALPSIADSVTFVSLSCKESNKSLLYHHVDIVVALV